MKNDSLKITYIITKKIENVIKGIINHFFSNRLPIMVAISTINGQINNTRINSFPQPRVNKIAATIPITINKVLIIFFSLSAS